MIAFGERIGWPAALFSLKCFAAAMLGEPDHVVGALVLTADAG